jgi:hypothetical protein
MPYFGNNPSPLLLNTVAQNGKEMTLDADADTSITADTDDQVDVKISGADDFRFTANTFTALSGSTIATNTISETTSGSGVTIDSVLLKDGGIDVNGNEIILDADADTSITADTDDQIDLRVGGIDTFVVKPDVVEIKGSHPDLKLTDSDDTNYGGLFYNNGAINLSADHDATGATGQINFVVDGSTKASITSGGNLRLDSANDFAGTDDTLQLGSSQQFKIYHNGGGGNSVACMLSTANSMQIFTDVIRFTSADQAESLFGADKDGGFFAKHDNNTAISTTANSGSAVRINFVDNVSNSDVTANNVKGIIMHHSGAIACSSAAGDVTGDFNRADDGSVLIFRSAGGTEGSISISGSTTSLGSMTGTHWSRLSDNSKPNILRGTVMETIDEMVDWYNVEFDKNIFYTESDDTIPNGKKVGDVKETITVQRQIGLLPDGKSVGDTTTYTDEDVEYTGKIVKQADEKHVKCKISDTAECTNVYGVFMSWDEDDDTVNDMNVASLGTMVVRIHKDQTVSKGDLLTSNGDGTAKKQSDDIIRTKTIGKVLTNIKQKTYSDGSYTVPCALYCG